MASGERWDRQQQNLKTQSDENRHRLDSQQQQLHQQQEGALRFQLRQQERPFQPTPAPPPSQPPSITCTQVGETFFCPSASIGPNGGANNVAKVWITLVLSGNTLYERTVLIKFEQEVCGQAEKEASRPGFQGQRPRLPH